MCTVVCSYFQGYTDLNKNGNLASFFSYVCNAKKFKELFFLLKIE